VIKQRDEESSFGHEVIRKKSLKMYINQEHKKGGYKVPLEEWIGTVMMDRLTVISI
jgi:hypothetical protein